MTPEEELAADVSGIVRGTIDRFPNVIASYLRKEARKLTKSIVKVSNKFTRAVVKEELEAWSQKNNT